MSFDCLRCDLADKFSHTRIERVANVNNGNLRINPVVDKYRKNFWGCNPAAFTEAVRIATAPDSDATLVTGASASTKSDMYGNVWEERTFRAEVEVPVTDILGKLRKLFCCCLPC